MVLRKPLVFIRKLRSLDRGEMTFAAQAWLLAPLMETSLLTLGVKRTIKGIVFLFRAKTPSTPDAPHAQRAEQLVNAAYRRHLVKGECLPRSLVQFSLMRRAGKRVRFVMGVNTHEDFRAHAWVETCGSESSHAKAEGLQFEKLLVVES
jgi:hypothetical protein